MDPAKVARVSEWPTPSNKKEIQSFLGFINFYQRFIEGFSHIAPPLFNLTKVDSTFKWSSKEKLAFNILRDRITLAPILVLLDLIVLRQTAQILLLELSCLRKIWVTESGTLSHSCPSPSPWWKGTMRSMTRKCLSPGRMEALPGRNQASV